MNQKLPIFHILCAGEQVGVYSWLAAKCLYQSAPEALKNELNIQVHLVGLNHRQRDSLERLFSTLNQVTLIYDTVQVDERQTGFDRFRMDLFNGKARHYSHRLQYKFPKLKWLLKHISGPKNREHMGLYHQEWINQICKDAPDDHPICVVDSDFFIADPDFFSPQALQLKEDEYAAGWIWRTNNSVQRQDETFLPLGTELILLRPKLHLQLNHQSWNYDFTSYDQLKQLHPNSKISNESFIDTLFEVSWNAQLSGYKVIDRFRNHKVCHPGGVGHISPEYFNNIPDEITDIEAWHKLNIGRIRLHRRTIELLKSLGQKHAILPSHDQRITEVENILLNDSELSSIWKSSEPLVDAEEYMNDVEGLFANQ